MVAVVILASAEWRSIRDHALVYLHQGAEPVSQHEEQPVVPPAVASDNTSAPVKEPSASGRPDERSSGGPSAVVVAPPAPGAAEMYQAAHASDPRLRAAWLWKAVRAGNPQATVELAKMYQEGDGVAQSCDQARILLNAAAAKGNAQAKLDLEQLELRGCSEP
ncbi:MAG: SEL1-like repeat protein [Candidatus Korobacteraceae bacterium]